MYYLVEIQKKTYSSFTKKIWIKFKILPKIVE